MHNAPPVVAPVGRFVWGSRILLGLAFMGAAGLYVWWLWAWPSRMNVLTAVVVWAGAGVLGRRIWSLEQLGGGHLVWTGEDWSWRDGQQEEIPVQLTLICDWGSGMLLSAKFEDGTNSRCFRTRYACMLRQQMPGLWHGLRCAVYSRPMV